MVGDLVIWKKNIFVQPVESQENQDNQYCFIFEKHLWDGIHFGIVMCHIASGPKLMVEKCKRAEFFLKNGEALKEVLYAHFDVEQ